VHANIKCLITQREVGAHTHSFANALRVATREDPDIILVGEMRGLETISLALNCASLGILVFGTLHTNSAAKTIDRIIDAFPSDQQGQVRSVLADSLMAVVAQQLVRMRDGKGRCAAVEILLGSAALGNLIREGKISQIPSLIQTRTAEGMQTMDQALMKLVNEGKITTEAAHEKAHDKNLFSGEAGGEGRENKVEIEKSKGNATVCVSDGWSLDVSLFLRQVAEGHSGREITLDILNSKAGFIPLEDFQANEILLANKSKIMWVELKERDLIEGTMLAPEIPVEVKLTNGEILTGSLFLEMPTGKIKTQ